MASEIRPHAPSAPKIGEELRDKAEQIGDGLRDMGRSAKEFAKEKTEDARRVGDELLEDGREKVREYEDQIVEYVRAKPIQSLLIALAAGVVIGAITRR